MSSSSDEAEDWLRDIVKFNSIVEGKLEDRKEDTSTNCSYLYKNIFCNPLASFFKRFSFTAFFSFCFRDLPLPIIPTQVP